MTTLNSTAVNTVILNGVEGAVDDTIPAEIVCSISQNVGIYVSVENVLQVQQEVDLYISLAAETVLNVSQKVEWYEAASNACAISQNVINTSALDPFLARNGWGAVVTIGGYVVPASFIHGNIVVTFEEDQPAMCTLSILVADASGFINDVWGEQIAIDYYTTTSSTRLYTGVVDLPEVDLINRYITLKCSDRRDDVIKYTFENTINPTIGRFSTNVFGIPTDPLQEYNYRMQTVQASGDFDNNNIFHLNSWYAKSSPDFSFTDSDIYYRTPKITFQDRSKIINDVTINLSYQYTRLYQYQRNWSWTMPAAGNVCDFLANQYSLLNVKMVEDAIKSAGWTTIGNITFESLWPNAVCGYGGAEVLVWQGIASNGTYSPQFDSTGHLINDPAGNNLYAFNPMPTTDLSTVYTLSAAWTASTRFSQYVQENYTINVIAPQSVAQFEDAPQIDTSSLSTTYDATQWEAYTAATAQPENAILQNGSYYSNQDTDQAQLFYDQMTCIDRAKYEILSTHRDTQLEVEQAIQPTLNLQHTVQYTASRVTAKGKVCKVIHTLDVKEGANCTSTVTLCMFRSVGTASTDATAPLARIVDNIVLPTQDVILPSKYGVTPLTTDVGYIGNMNNPRQAGAVARTSIQEEFRVDTPAIPPEMRALRPLNDIKRTFNVAIPNDTLVVYFA